MVATVLNKSDWIEEYLRIKVHDKLDMMLVAALELSWDCNTFRKQKFISPTMQVGSLLRARIETLAKGGRKLKYMR